MPEVTSSRYSSSRRPALLTSSRTAPSCRQKTTRTSGPGASRQVRNTSVCSALSCWMATLTQLATARGRSSVEFIWLCPNNLRPNWACSQLGISALDDSSRIRSASRRQRKRPARAGLELGGGTVRGPSWSPRGCEPSASTHASAVSGGNRGGVCTCYTVLLSRESSTAGGRRFGKSRCASRLLSRDWTLGAMRFCRFGFRKRD